MCVIFNHILKLRGRCVIYTHLFYIRWNQILKKVLATRIMLAPQKENVCSNFHGTERNLKSFEEISCHRKKFSDTEQILLSQEEISCHGKKFAFTARKNLLSREDIFHKKYFSCETKFIFFLWNNMYLLLGSMQVLYKQVFPNFGPPPP